MSLNKLVTLGGALALACLAHAQSLSGTWTTEAIAASRVGTSFNVTLSITQETGGLRILETIRFQEGQETVVEDTVSKNGRPTKKHNPMTFTQTRDYAVTFGSSRKADGGRCDVRSEKPSTTEISFFWTCKQGENDAWTVEEHWVQDASQPNRMIVRRLVDRTDRSKEVRSSSTSAARVEFALVR